VGSLLRAAQKAGPRAAKGAASSGGVLGISWVLSPRCSLPRAERGWLQGLELGSTSADAEAACFHISVLSAPRSKGTLHRSVPLGHRDSTHAWGPSRLQQADRSTSTAARSSTAVDLGEREPVEGNGCLQLSLSSLPGQPSGVSECHGLQSLHVAC